MDGQTEKAAVEGTVEEIIFSNRENGYTVCLLSCGGEPVTVVGTLPGVGEGEKLKVSGTWQMHPSFGRQLRAEEYERSLPQDEDSILRRRKGVRPRDRFADNGKIRQGRA